MLFSGQTRPAEIASQYRPPQFPPFPAPSEPRSSTTTLHANSPVRRTTPVCSGANLDVSAKQRIESEIQQLDFELQEVSGHLHTQQMPVELLKREAILNSRYLQLLQGCRSELGQFLEGKQPEEHPSLLRSYKHRQFSGELPRRNTPSIHTRH